MGNNKSSILINHGNIFVFLIYYYPIMFKQIFLYFSVFGQFYLIYFKLFGQKIILILLNAFFTH